jgi:glucokinase
MQNVLLGIDIGGTNIKIGCLDSGLKIIDKVSKLNRSDIEPQEMVELIVADCKKLLAQAGLVFAQVQSIGVGSPGPLDPKSGILKSAPNLKKFHNTPLREMLSKKMGKPVVLENDANAACWGERIAGAGSGGDDMVFLTLGTGIGGGIVSNGQLIRGTSGEAAELGHIIIYPGGRLCGCGQRGCVEAYASATNTAKRAIENLQQNNKSTLKKILETNGKITCKDVFGCAQQGDEFAKQMVEQTAEALGLVCVNILHVTQPQRIVFGGGMIAAGKYLLDKIQYHFDKYIWTIKKEDIQLCFATLGEDAGIIGAAALAREL